MWIYFARRFFLAIMVVVVAVTLLNAMLHAVPGDPAVMILGPRATPELIAEFRTKMGLDQPFHIQMLTFFGELARGNMGQDVFTGRSVSQIVFEQLPYTLILISVSILWAAAVGIPLGCYSAIRRNSLIDKITGVFSVGTIAIPAFVMALYALLIFAVELKWLPAIGAGEGFWDSAERLVLPAFAVGISWVGYMARIVRASMLEVLGENHVRMARSFGLSESRIVFRYALPIAILPTITLLGVGVAYLVSGAVFAEVIFARPGIGALIVQAVDSRNYPIVLGCVLVTTVLFVVATLISDLVNALLDPRAREGI